MTKFELIPDLSQTKAYTECIDICEMDRSIAWATFSFGMPAL